MKTDEILDTKAIPTATQARSFARVNNAIGTFFLGRQHVGYKPDCACVEVKPNGQPGWMKWLLRQDKVLKVWRKLHNGGYVATYFVLDVDLDAHKLS